MFPGFARSAPQSEQMTQMSAPPPLFRGGMPDASEPSIPQAAPVYARAPSDPYPSAQLQEYKPPPQYTPPAREPSPEDVRAVIRHEVRQSLANVHPQHPPAQTQSSAPPVQVVIRNTTSSTSQNQTIAQPPAPAPQPVVVPKTGWAAVSHVLQEFWASPANRIFLLTSLGAVLYIYQGQAHHRWRMDEMQRRIDRNPFLRLVQQTFASSSTTTR